jgi:uncharacterized protein YaaQ
MTHSKRTAGVIAALGLVSTMAGCSTMSSDLPDDPVARIKAAKSASQSAEQLVAGFVPKKEVKSLHQTRTGSLLACSSGKQWSGNTTLSLVSGQDDSRLVDEISRRAEDSGFDVEQDKTRSGTPRVTLTADSGVSLLVGVWNDGTVVNIDSFSMCFSLPDGFLPEPSY